MRVLIGFRLTRYVGILHWSHQEARSRSLSTDLRFLRMQIPVLPYRQGLEAIQGGSVSSYGITAMGKSIELLLEIGIDRVYSHCLRLENLFRKGLSPLEDKVQILGSKDCKYWSGVICLKFDKDRTKQMKNAFADKKIYAHIREGYLRISFHYYNSPDQVLLTVQTLTDVLK